MTSANKEKIMNVQVKFRCLGIDLDYIPQPGAVCATLRLAPVWEQDGPNKSWSEATPQGELTMRITNPAAVDAFELGGVYVATFEHVPE